MCSLFLVVLLYLSFNSGTSVAKYTRKNRILLQQLCNFFTKCSYTTLALSSLFFFSVFYDIFLHCLTADVNTRVVQRAEAGGRNPGVGDEGKKWQGFREGGITQWAGSPAGGGIDGYLNRPAQRLRVWRYNGPEVGCHSVRRWYVAAAGRKGGMGRAEGAAKGRNRRGRWGVERLVGQRENTHAHTNTPAVIDWRRRGPLSRNLHLWQPFFPSFIYFNGGTLTRCPSLTCHKNREWPFYAIKPLKYSTELQNTKYRLAKLIFLIFTYKSALFHWLCKYVFICSIYMFTWGYFYWRHPVWKRICLFFLSLDFS